MLIYLYGYIILYVFYFLYRRYIMLYSTRFWQKLFLTAYKSPEFVINPRDLPNKNDWGPSWASLSRERAEKVERFSIQKKGTWARKKGMSLSINLKKQVIKWWKKWWEEVRFCTLHHAFGWFLVDVLLKSLHLILRKLCKKILPNKGLVQGPSAPKISEATVEFENRSMNFLGGVMKSRWWFETCFIFTPTWGNDPIWLICFNWVETTKI